MTVKRRKRDKKEDNSAPHRKSVIRGWNAVRQRLRKKDINVLEEEFSIFLEDNPKLIRTVKAPYYSRDILQMSWFGQDLFLFVGFKPTVKRLMVFNNGRDIKYDEIPFPYPLLKLRHLEKNRVFVGLSCEKMLLVINVIRGVPKLVCTVDQLFQALAMCTIQEIATTVVGGIGFLKYYSMSGLMQTSAVQPGHKVSMTLRDDEWVSDVQVETYTHCLLVITESGINIIDYYTWQQIGRFEDSEGGTLSCCCVFGHNTFLITGSRFGHVKVWSTTIKVLMHRFTGHRGSITAVACHKKEPLLFSGSDDGWVFIWRLDTFRKFKQVNVGECVSMLGVSSHDDSDTVGFWCQFDNVLKFYEMCEPYRFYSVMDSRVIKLKRLLGRDECPNRILLATGDGGVWFKNPLTAETVGFMYPIIALKMIDKYVYDVLRQRLHMVLPSGGVLTLSCVKNPFRAVDQLPERTPDEVVNCLVDLFLSVGTEERSFDTVVILMGLQNGQIELMDSESLTMPLPLQAHHGSVVCLETLTETAPGRESTYNTHSVVVSGGSDMMIKVWQLRVDVNDKIGFELCLLNVFEINCNKIPKYMAAFDDRVAAVFLANTTLEMYSTKGITKESCEMSTSRFSSTSNLCLTHTEDYDHKETVTALDKCPLLRIFATSSMDKTVKIWSDQNDLLRELVFEEPVVDICFATDTGDILITRDFVLVYSSVEKYLPWSYLAAMLPKHYKREIKENPKPLQESGESWVNPQHVPTRHSARHSAETGRPTSSMEKTPQASTGFEEWHLVWNASSGLKASMSVPVRFPRRINKFEAIRASGSESSQVKLNQRDQRKKRLSIRPPKSAYFKNDAALNPGRSEGAKPAALPILSEEEESSGASLHRSVSNPDSLDKPRDSQDQVWASSDLTIELALKPIVSKRKMLFSPWAQQPDMSLKIDENRPKIEDLLMESSDFFSFIDVPQIPTPAGTMTDILKMARLDAIKYGLVPLRPRSPTRAMRRTPAVTVSCIEDVEKEADGSSSSICVNLEGCGATSTDDYRDIPPEYNILRSRQVSPLRALLFSQLDCKAPKDVTVVDAPPDEATKNARSVPVRQQNGLTNSQTRKMFREYRHQVGCGPVGPLLPRQPKPPSPCSSETSYADSEEFDWRKRCMQAPVLPNSVFKKTKKHRPPPPLSYEEKFYDKVMRMFDELYIFKRNHPIFKKEPRPPATETDEEDDNKKKKGKKKGKNKNSKKRNKGPLLYQWETTEEFAPIRREVLPVFSTRLFPRTPSETIRFGATEAANAASVVADVTEDVSKIARARLTKEEPHGSNDHSPILSSTDVIMHMEMLACYREHWFPRNVQRKTKDIFKAMLGMLDVKTPPNTLVEVLTYVGTLIREGRLPEKLRKMAADKMTELINKHTGINVRRAGMSVLADIAPLDKTVVQIMYRNLNSIDAELLDLTKKSLNRYGLTTKEEFLGKMVDFKLLQTPVVPKPLTLDAMEEMVASKLENSQNSDKMLGQYEEMFKEDCYVLKPAPTRFSKQEAMFLTKAVPNMRSKSPQPTLITKATVSKKLPLIRKSTFPSQTKHGVVEKQTEAGSIGSTLPETSEEAAFRESQAEVEQRKKSVGGLTPADLDSIFSEEIEQEIRTKMQLVEQQTKEDRREASAHTLGSRYSLRSSAMRLSHKSSTGRSVSRSQVTSPKASGSMSQAPVSRSRLGIPSGPPQRLHSSDSRSSLHFISTDDENDDNAALSDSSFVHAPPARSDTKVKVSSRDRHDTVPGTGLTSRKSFRNGRVHQIMRPVVLHKRTAEHGKAVHGTTCEVRKLGAPAGPVRAHSATKPAPGTAETIWESSAPYGPTRIPSASKPAPGTAQKVLEYSESYGPTGTPSATKPTPGTAYEVLKFSASYGPTGTPSGTNSAPGTAHEALKSSSFYGPTGTPSATNSAPGTAYEVLKFSASYGPTGTLSGTKPTPGTAQKVLEYSESYGPTGTPSATKPTPGTAYEVLKFSESYGPTGTPSGTNSAPGTAHEALKSSSFYGPTGTPSATNSAPGTAYEASKSSTFYGPTGTPSATKPAPGTAQKVLESSASYGPTGTPNSNKATSQPPAPSRAAETRVKQKKDRSRLQKATNKGPMKAPGCHWIPGEPGVRVHHKTLVTADKIDRPKSVPHIVQPLTGRLGVVNANWESGHSHYGKLDLAWTTRIPAVPVKSMAYMYRKKKMGCLQDTQHVLHLPRPGAHTRQPYPTSVLLTCRKPLPTATDNADYWMSAGKAKTAYLCPPPTR